MAWNPWNEIWMKDSCSLYTYVNQKIELIRDVSTLKMLNKYMNAYVRMYMWILCRICIRLCVCNE